MLSAYSLDYDSVPSGKMHLQVTGKKSRKRDAHNLTTTLQDKIRSAGLNGVKFRTHCVDVKGGHLAIFLTLDPPASLTERGKAQMRKLANQECAAFLFEATEDKNPKQLPRKIQAQNP